MLRNPVVTKLNYKAGIGRSDADAKKILKQFIHDLIAKELLPKIETIMNYEHKKTILPQHVEYVAKQYKKLFNKVKKIKKCKAYKPKRDITAKEQLRNKIKFYQADCSVIAPSVFRKLIRKYIHKNKRINTEAANTLQILVEKMIVDVLEISTTHIKTGNRQTLSGQDLKYAIDIYIKLGNFTKLHQHLYSHIIIKKRKKSMKKKKKLHKARKQKSPKSPSPPSPSSSPSSPVPSPPPHRPTPPETPLTPKMASTPPASTPTPPKKPASSKKSKKQKMKSRALQFEYPLTPKMASVSPISVPRITTQQLKTQILQMQAKKAQLNAAQTQLNKAKNKAKKQANSSKINKVIKQVQNIEKRANNAANKIKKLRAASARKEKSKNVIKKVNKAIKSAQKFKQKIQKSNKIKNKTLTDVEIAIRRQKTLTELTQNAAKKRQQKQMEIQNEIQAQKKELNKAIQNEIQLQKKVNTTLENAIQLTKNATNQTNNVTNQIKQATNQLHLNNANKAIKQVEAAVKSPPQKPIKKIKSPQKQIPMKKTTLTTIPEGMIPIQVKTHIPAQLAAQITSPSKPKTPEGKAKQKTPKSARMSKKTEKMQPKIQKRRRLSPESQITTRTEYLRLLKIIFDKWWDKKMTDAEFHEETEKLKNRLNIPTKKLPHKPPTKPVSIKKIKKTKPNKTDQWKAVKSRYLDAYLKGTDKKTTDKKHDIKKRTTQPHAAIPKPKRFVKKKTNVGQQKAQLKPKVAGKKKAKVQSRFMDWYKK